MQRVTLTLDDDLLAALDALSARRGYHNISPSFSRMRLIDRKSVV